MKLQLQHELPLRSSGISAYWTLCIVSVSLITGPLFSYLGLALGFTHLLTLPGFAWLLILHHWANKNLVRDYDLPAAYSREQVCSGCDRRGHLALVGYPYYRAYRDWTLPLFEASSSLRVDCLERLSLCTGCAGKGLIASAATVVGYSTCVSVLCLVGMEVFLVLAYSVFVLVAGIKLRHFVTVRHTLVFLGFRKLRRRSWFSSSEEPVTSFEINGERRDFACVVPVAFGVVFASILIAGCTSLIVAGISAIGFA